MEDRIGIVLKKYFPFKRKLSILDKQLGRVDYISMAEDICVGSLIRYNSTMFSGMASMHTIEQIGLPLHLARKDILFFHHVLELCYHFVPEGSCFTELFSLVEYLYSIEQRSMTSVFKKIFLVKFFTLLGIYPEDKKFRKPYIHHVASTAIDLLADTTIQGDLEKELDEWLRSCVSIHPRIDTFKTMHFLDESRML